MTLGPVEKVIVPDEKLVLLNVDLDAEAATAQAVCHLDMGHQDIAGVLSAEEQERAAWLAKVRIDAPGSRPWTDTEEEPTKGG